MKRATLVVLATLLIGGAAQAQPMMVDPSRMSGIPRPDPQVPAGTVTVRLIRGELSNRMVGVSVSLLTQDGTHRDVKTDAEGRATFAGLSGGPFIASAKDDGGQEVTSQPIELQDGMGTRVMLVFSTGGPGTPDGVGRPSKELAPGTIVVRALDEAGKPLAGLEVMLGHARAGENSVEELKAKTDAKGEARFEGQDRKPTSGYLPEVKRDGTRYAGKPFRLSDNMGSLVAIEVRRVSSDLSLLKMSQGSHLIIELQDDAVEIVELWRIENIGDRTVDPGPAGLRLPLPDGAVTAQVGQGSPPNFTVDGHTAVWKGPIPPGVAGGDQGLQVAFLVAYKGDTLDVAQTVPLALDELAVVHPKIDKLKLEVAGGESQERELGGRTFVLTRGSAIKAGESLKLHLTGLPHGNAMPRYAAAALVVLLIIGFGVYAAMGNGVSPVEQRRQLERERERLLSELVALGPESADGKKKKKREQLAEELAGVYQRLDEVGELSGGATFSEVALEGVGKAYGRQRALAGVGLTLRAGEITVLLGPNGAGKSTLLGILSSQVRPSSGAVRYGSEPLAPELRGAVGLIAHESLCYADLSGRENLRFFARLYGANRAEAKARADRMITRVALDDAADRPARTYSRGMVQRLAVARALQHQPQLVLADEPFTGLDRDGVALLAALLAEERARGAIVLVVTHDFDAVEPIADRALVLARGRLVADQALVRVADQALVRVADQALVKPLSELYAAALAAAKTSTGNG